jgi:hypothetical protein
MQKNEVTFHGVAAKKDMVCLLNPINILGILILNLSKSCCSTLCAKSQNLKSNSINLLSWTTERDSQYQYQYQNQNLIPFPFP